MFYDRLIFERWRAERAAIRAIRMPVPEALRFFSVCSGIEAASVAWKPIGWKCVGVAEIEKFPSAVLAHHYPDIPNHGNFTKIDTKRLGRVDVLCGGTPCQAFSIAGARRSLDDARGNLTLAFVGLAHELADDNGLRNVVWENVPGVLSTKDNAFGCFLAALVGADEPLVPIEPRPVDGKSNRWWGWSAKERRHYVKWPRAGLVDGPKGRAAWTIKDAQYFGLAQRRERVILVADFGNGADPAAVLFEPEGVRRDSPPSRETGQRVTSTISARTSGGGGLGTDFDLDGGLIANSLRSGNGGDPHDYTKGTYIPQIAKTVICMAHGQGGAAIDANFRPASTCNHEAPIAAYTLSVESVTGAISHALSTQQRGATEDGTGRGTPIICVHGTQDPCTSNHIAFAMQQNNGQENVVAYAVALRGREGGGSAELGDDRAFALRASGGGGDKPHVLTHAIQAGALRENPNSGPDGVGVQAHITYTLEARAEVQAVQIGSAVRRLTPRYKALGNSWAVPKFRWLGERITRLMPI